MKVNWNIQRGGAIIGKILYLGEVWNYIVAIPL